MLKEAQALIAEQVVLPLFGLKLKKFMARTNQAQDIQNAFLLDHIKQSTDTRFGRDHGFASINTIEDFKKRVPRQTNVELAPYIEDVAAGRKDALFPDSDEVLCFSSTTGTTGDPKIVPVTKRWLEAYRRTWEVWGVKNFIDHPEVIGGRKLLQITGPSDLGHTPSGALISMASALTVRYQTPFLKVYYPVPMEIADIADVTKRYYTMLRISLREPVGFIATITPGNMVRLAETGDQHAQSLIRDIHDGTFNAELVADEVISDSLRKSLSKKRPDLAHKFEQIIEQTGTFYPKDYWPLSILACWLGGTVGYQARQLTRYYGDTPKRDLGYVSTEGRHSIPLGDETPIGVLSYESGSCYEFINAEQADDPDAPTLDGASLKDGADYRILITAANGLWRYDMGDIVRCRGHLGTAPLIEFLSKTSHVADMEGEKLSGNQVAEAIGDACDQLELNLAYFTCIPVRPENEPPYYGVIIEEGVLPDTQTQQRFIQIFDENLIRQNVMLSGKRNDRFIGEPRLITIPREGWRQLIVQQTGRRGTGDTQYKHPPLTTDPKWIADLETITGPLTWQAVDGSAKPCQAQPSSARRHFSTPRS